MAWEVYIHMGQYLQRLKRCLSSDQQVFHMPVFHPKALTRSLIVTEQR